MSSILTNVGAMQALQSINSTNRSLATTQNRISTGLRVHTRRTTRPRGRSPRRCAATSSGFKAISENLALSTSSISVARTGAETVSDLLNKIKEKVVQANGHRRRHGQDPGATSISCSRQIDSVANAAEFNGTNFIKATPDSADLSGVHGPQQPAPWRCRPSRSPAPT
jgi:flagellin